MGKIAEFLGNPGARPDVHHRAPTVDCKQYEEFGDSNDYKNDDVVRVVSHSDESTDDELCNVNLTETGAIFTSKGFTGLSKGFTDKTLDFLVQWPVRRRFFYCLDHPHNLGGYWYCL